jgi:hypothetical protein
MVMIVMTSATSSMTEDTTGKDCRPPIGVLQYELPRHQGGAHFTLWHQGSGRSPGSIDKYNDSINPEKFIQIYHTVIEAVGGDDRVKANYLPTALTSAARSWLINLPEGTIYNWDQLCVMFIRNF